MVFKMKRLRWRGRRRRRDDDSTRRAVVAKLFETRQRFTTMFVGGEQGCYILLLTEIMKENYMNIIQNIKV